MSTKPTGSKGSANVKKVVKSIGQEKSYNLPSAKQSERKERVPGFTDPKLPVYIVHSQLSVDDIRKTLVDLDAGSVGTVKIDYDRFGKETNRTIVIAEPSVYEAAVAAGLDKRSRKFDFAITPYELREHNQPFTNCLYSFYIPFPKDFDISAQDARKQVEGLFDELVNHGLLEDGSYRVSVPLKSREIGEPRGHVFVTFSRDVTDRVIELAKVAIDHSLWVSGVEFDSWEELRCLWSRDPKSRPKTPKVKASKDTEEKAVLQEQVTGPVVRTFVNGKAQESVFSSAPAKVVKEELPW